MRRKGRWYWQFIVLLAALGLLLAACNSPSAANGADTPLDARALFSQEDAEALMGEPSLEADCTDTHVEGVATVSNCLYSAAADDSDKTVSLLARRSVRADTTLSAEVRAGISEGGEEPVELEGIGDTAFWNWGLSDRYL